MRFIVCLFLCCLSGTMLAQEEKLRLLGLDLLSPSLSYAPRYTLHYKQTAGKRFLWGIGMGYGNTPSSFNFAEKGGFIHPDYRSWSVLPEFNYILAKNKQNLFYIGLTGSYINHQDQFNQDYFRKASDHKQYAFEQADYRRIKTTLSMHMGSVLFVGKNWGFSPYIGWGVKNRDVKFSHIQNMRPVTREDTHNWLPSSSYYLRHEGSSTGVQLELRLAVFVKL